MQLRNYLPIKFLLIIHVAVLEQSIMVEERS